MNQLTLALIYKLFPGTGVEVQTVGDGAPSHICNTLFNFPWPVGTTFTKNGHSYLVEQNDVKQTDTE